MYFIKMQFKLIMLKKFIASRKVSKSDLNAEFSCRHNSSLCGQTCAEHFHRIKTLTTTQLYDKDKDEDSAAS